MIGNKEASGTILQLGLVPFGSLHQRPQQLALELAKHADVVYVEPHRSVVGQAFLPASPSLKRKRGKQSPTLAYASGSDRALPPRLRVFQPGMVIPFSGYVPPVNRLNYVRTAQCLQRYLRRVALAPLRAILASFPKHLDLLPWFQGVPVVYDVMDDYPLFFDAWQGAVIAKLHERLLAQASLTVTSSHTLADRCRPVARRVQCITNGVNDDFVRACESAKPDVSILSLARPRLGYVGTISWWFDFEVVRQLAEAFPGGSVVLIGPVSVVPPPLPPNVHFLGPRPHADVPAALRAFDLGLIPFRTSRLIDAVNPVKVYEYFAAGLPVASSPFAEILPFAPLVTICRTRQDWQASALSSMSVPTKEDIARRRGVARENCWSAKAEALLAALHGVTSTSRAA